MRVLAPNLQILGHPIVLKSRGRCVYSDEFKHMLIYFYKAALTDIRYMHIKRNIAGRKFLQVFFQLDVVPNWTLYGGTFVTSPIDGGLPISNQRAIEILTQRFAHGKNIPNWMQFGYGFLRQVIFARSHSDFQNSNFCSDGINPETPIFPPTAYVTQSTMKTCSDPILSRAIYNSKRTSIDKRKFQKCNNQYVNGALYKDIPSTCTKIVPDNKSNSRIVINVLLEDKSWSKIVITKYNDQRVKKLNDLITPFHKAYEDVRTGKG